MADYSSKDLARDIVRKRGTDDPKHKSYLDDNKWYLKTKEPNKGTKPYKRVYWKTTSAEKNPSEKAPIRPPAFTGRNIY